MLRVSPKYELEFYDITSKGSEVQFTAPTSGTYGIYLDYNQEQVLHGRSDMVVSSASTIKLITALSVLDALPMNGQSFSMTDKDVGFYTNQLAENGSVLPISAGESYTYTKLLEGLLIASANNIADSLAIRAYGSVDEFVRGTNTYLQRNQITHTAIADPSGLAPQTTTTADDMLLVARLAYANETIRSIVSQKTTDWPGGISISNTNRVLGINGVNGLKTGTTDEAGACLVSSVELGDGLGVAYIVVFGQPSHSETSAITLSFIDTIKANIVTRHIVTEGQQVGEYTAPWGEKVAVNATKTLTSRAWAADDIGSVGSRGEHKDDKGESVGKLQVLGQTSDIVLAEDMPKPSLLWRAQHALDFLW